MATPAEADGPAALLVYHRDGPHVIPVVEGDTVVLGRAPPSDLRIECRRLSRRHAAFAMGDGRITVSDLASTNGTFLNGRRIEGPTLVGLDDEVTLGSASVALTGSSPPAHTLLDLDRFGREIAREIRRSETFGRGLALVMIRSADPSGGKRLASWVPELMARLRPVDIAAVHGADRVVVLMPEADAVTARHEARVWMREIGEMGPTLTAGVSAWPGHGGDEGTLMSRAAAALDLAEPAQVALPQVDAAVAASEVPPGQRIVSDPAMVELYRTVDQVATSTISVLIVGETGCGKEVVARAIHEASPRRDAPLRVINCGAIPPTLLESTLFGHERGSFTGAEGQRSGVFEEAAGGTVFLDEIGELSLQAQVALLRVLETHRIQRVGSSSELEVDVRVLAATHRDLEAMCGERTFRLDLLYRLNPITLEVSPLRERVGEIRGLVAHFIGAANRTHGRHLLGMGPDALACLEAYPWPGNVRELRNVVDRAVVMASGQVIAPDDLPERVRSQGRSPEPTAPRRSAPVPEISRSLDLKAHVNACQAEWIRAALHRCAGNRTRAASLLGLPRRTLAYKLRTYGIEDGDPVAMFPEGFEAGSFAEQVRRVEGSLLAAALRRARGDRNAAARLLNIQKRTLEDKLVRLGLIDGT